MDSSTPQISISQSMLKMLVDYLNEKACGLLFKAIYIDKDPATESEPSEAMKAGIYFEFLATGALPKSGKMPAPEYTSKGVLKEAYVRATQSAGLFRRTIAAYGIEIVGKGEYLSATIPGGVHINGTTDIRAIWNGKRVTIDLKYSGLLHDKWNEMGWELESLPLKDTLMVQGVHYKLLERLNGAPDDTDFYFFVFNSQVVEDARIIHQIVDEDRIQQHIVALNQAHEKIMHGLKNGFKALPDLSRCSQCPLRPKCSKKIDVPKIYTVYY